MNPYAIAVKRSAQKDLGRLPRRVQDQLSEAIADLAVEPRPPGVAKIEGRVDRYRVRVGDYRIVFDIDDDARLVTVTALGHRSAIYRRLSLIVFVIRSPMRQGLIRIVTAHTGCDGRRIAGHR